MITKEYVKTKVLKLLPIDSELYSDQVDILLGGAMNKLKNEGVDSTIIDTDTDLALDYCICVSYQIAMDIDADVDHQRLMKQYVTRVNTLRTSLNV